VRAVHVHVHAATGIHGVQARLVVHCTLRVEACAPSPPSASGAKRPWWRCAAALRAALYLLGGANQEAEILQGRRQYKVDSVNQNQAFRVRPYHDALPHSTSLRAACCFTGP
jgi:hypothetical protein